MIMAVVFWVAQTKPMGALVYTAHMPCNYVLDIEQPNIPLASSSTVRTKVMHSWAKERNCAALFRQSQWI